jgi:hypothetical protein
MSVKVADYASTGYQIVREEEIRLIAYNMWEEENCPKGKDCEHWLMAEAIWESGKKHVEVRRTRQPGRVGSQEVR